MEVFCTGGTGFIGSYVVNELLSKGDKIRILARNPEKVKGFLNNPDISFIKGKLKDREAVREGLSGCDACVHIALGWGDKGVSMLENDTLTSVFIFETALDMGIKKIVYTSSTAAVGEIRKEMDTDSVCHPVDLYGAAKASAEKYLEALSKYYPDTQCNIIRPGYTFGNPVVEGADTQPDQRFNDIVKNALNDKDIQLIKHDGTQFICADDLAKIYSAVLEGELDNRIFFGLGNEFITWEEVAQRAIAAANSESRVYLEDKGWDKDYGNFDVSGIQETFGFSFNPRKKIDEHISYFIRTLQ
ncbi:MAG: NAD-dependent epimerase/dehydratase family protein [Chitinivibrionales bacterium]